MYSGIMGGEGIEIMQLDIFESTQLSKRYNKMAAIEITKSLNVATKWRLLHFVSKSLNVTTKWRLLHFVSKSLNGTTKWSLSPKNNLFTLDTK